MKGLILNFDVKNQIICYGEQNQTVADSINYLRCRFTFTDDWKNNKYCVFYGAEDENKPISIPLVLDEDGGYYCTAPHEIIKPPFFKLSVYCEENGVLITSGMQKVHVRPSGYSDDTREPDPAPPLNEYMRVSTKNDESGAPFIRQNGGILEFSKNGFDWTAVKAAPSENIIQSGVWTPELYGSAVMGNPVYAERRGTWAIIGNIYKIDLYIELASLGGAEGYINIFGLPFASSKVIFNNNNNAFMRSRLLPGEQTIAILLEWVGLQVWEDNQLKRYMNHSDLNNNSIIRLSFEWQE